MDCKTEKASFISEASAKKFLQRVQDTVDMVIKSDDFGNQDLETVKGLLEDVETLISESYAKSKGWAKEYLTAEIMLIALKARISRSCEKSDNVKCENSSEESLNVEAQLSEPFLKSDNVKSENSNKENLNDEAPLVQSKGKTGEVKDSAGAIKGLLPPSLEQLKLIDCVNGVQSLPPPGGATASRSD